MRTAPSLPPSIHLLGHAQVAIEATIYWPLPHLPPFFGGAATDGTQRNRTEQKLLYPPPSQTFLTGGHKSRR